MLLIADSAVICTITCRTSLIYSELCSIYIYIGTYKLKSVMIYPAWGCGSTPVLTNSCVLANTFHVMRKVSLGIAPWVVHFLYPVLTRIAGFDPGACCLAFAYGYVYCCCSFPADATSGSSSSGSSGCLATGRGHGEQSRVLLSICTDYILKKSCSSCPSAQHALQLWVIIWSLVCPRGLLGIGACRSVLWVCTRCSSSQLAPPGASAR